MPNEYVEIVHVEYSLDAFREQGPRQKAIADRISQIENTIGVKYIEGSLDSEIPYLPKDTPIRVGGAMWNMCVQWRVEELKKAGYQKVRADRTISFAGEDAYKDAGFLKEDSFRRFR